MDITPTTTREDFALIHKIARRGAGNGLDFLTVALDVEYAHAQIPMDLGRLLLADDFNFSHDVGGIGRHINRETGQMEDCFVPRFARAG